MRSAIACITTLATVMHLACGCCLHATHFGAASACCPVDHLAAHDCGGDHDDGCDHGHDAAPINNSVESPDVLSVADPVTVGEDAARHNCPGCRCMAMTEPQRPFDPGDPQDRTMVPFDEGWLPSAAAFGALRRLASDPVLSMLRPPLFERLSI